MTECKNNILVMCDHDETSGKPLMSDEDQRAIENLLVLKHGTVAEIVYTVRHFEKVDKRTDFTLDLVCNGDPSDPTDIHWQGVIEPCEIQSEYSECRHLRLTCPENGETYKDWYAVAKPKVKS